MPLDPDLAPILDEFRSRLTALESKLPVVLTDILARLARLEAFHQTPPAGIPQIGKRTDVSNWIGVNIQCVPQAEIDRRKAAGEPRLTSIHDLNERAHVLDYPATLAGYEHLTAKAMLDFLDPLPAGTRTNGPVYRDFVNTGQLTEAGEYTAPGREQFMREWIANGGRVMFVNAAIINESPTYPAKAAGADAVKAEFLSIGPQAVATMQRIAKLIARLTPAEQRAVLAVEPMNEPAFYRNAGMMWYANFGQTEQSCLDQFEADNAAAARALVAAGIPNHILILFPRYGYNADADLLKRITPGRDTSILDRWVAEFGDRMGISTHKYAGWVPGQYTDEWARNMIADLDKIPREIPQVVTETNGSDFRAGERKAAAHHFGWTLAEIMAATEIPFHYFPGANWGGAPLYRSQPNPDHMNNPDRMFTWYDALTRVLRPEPVDVTLPIHVIRSETDARYVAGNDDDRIRAGFRLIRMGDGDRDLVLSGPEAIMCYGGEGAQRVTMNRDEFSWFSGWTGNDTVDASQSPGCIVNLGDGEDTILLGGKGVTVHGRGGGDTFVLADRGDANVFGFGAGDRIEANGVKHTVALETDVTLRTAGGGIVRFVGQRTNAELAAVKAAIK